MENRKSVPKPNFSNIMLVKSVNKCNPNPTKIQEMHIFCRRPSFLEFERANFIDSFGILWDVLPDCPGKLEAPC